MQTTYTETQILEAYTVSDTATTVSFYPAEEGSIIKVELVRNAPDNPCLIGSGIDYECKVLPAGITVDNYDWRYILHCKTASTDPYQCPEASGHNTVGIGPSGSGADKWVSSILGYPYWSHAGEHEVTCKVTVGGLECTASMIQEVQPKIEVSNVSLLSPAADGSWPYDPVWHDTDWAATVDGSLAVACANDTDQASVEYELSKIASIVHIEIYKDIFGPSNPLLQSTSGTTAKGTNTVAGCWDIDSEDIDDYFATVKAQGINASDAHSENSPNVDIRRRDIYTADSVSPMASSSVDNVWQYTATVHSLLVGAGYTTTFSIGSWYTCAYLGASSVWAAIISGNAGLIFAAIMPGTTAPPWMAAENWVYHFGPWEITQYWWDSSTATYQFGFYPGIGVWTQWNISAVEIYHNSITVCPPPAGAAPLLTRFHNHFTDAGFSEAEMIKTPWDAGMLDENAYGLLSPDFSPAAP